MTTTDKVPRKKDVSLSLLEGRDGLYVTAWDRDDLDSDQRYRLSMSAALRIYRIEKAYEKRAYGAVLTPEMVGEPNMMGMDSEPLVEGEATADLIARINALTPDEANEHLLPGNKRTWSLTH